MEEVKENEVERLISEAFDKQSMVGFDHKISHLFQSVFYSFSLDAVVMGKIKWYPGIVTHFLKNWKDSIGFSSISKTLPAIITGSIVEGACLSRIFHPSKDASLELEADVMYVVGSITQNVAEKCFQDMTSPGFLRIRNSPEIQVFTKECLVNHQDVIFTNKSTGEEFIDGSKFKIMHRNMQPQNPRLWLNKNNPYIIDIQQQISGPSSEIIFTSMEIRNPEKLQMVIDCLERIDKRWSEECHDLLDAVHKGQCVHESCIKNLAAAISKEERSLSGLNLGDESTNENDYKDVLSKDEIIELLLKYQSMCMETYEKCVSLLDSEESIKFLVDGKTDSKYEGKFNSMFAKGLIREVFHNTLFEGMSDLSLLGQLKKMNNHLENLLVEMYFFKDQLFVVWIKEKRDRVKSKIQLSVQQLQKRVYECKNLHEDVKSSGEESTISFDNVSCFHCPFWPKIAEEWETRIRQWPSPEQIQTVIDAGCFVVAKPLKPDSQEGILDWRWSFSSAEISLANFRTESMKFCYFIFKSLFYRFLKKETEDGKCLPSYVAKTCMLYASENLGASWFEENSIAHCVLSLLRDLRQSLMSGIVAHYFIPKLNLLTGMPQTVIEKAVCTLTELLESPSKFFTFRAENLERIGNIKKEVEQLHSFTASRLNVVDPLEHFDSVTQSNKDLLLVKIEGFRCSRLVELYSIWSKMNNFRYTQPTIKDALETQQMIFSFPGNEGMEAKDLRFQENLKNYQKSAEELSRLEEVEPVKRKILTKQLAKINNLLETKCRQCQKCLVRIDCKSQRCYQCTSSIDLDIECQYIECELCYKKTRINEEGNGETGFKGENHHHHRMIKSEECLKQCSARIDEEDVGRDMLMEIISLTNKMQSLKGTTIKEGSKIGFSNKKFVSFFGGQGKLVAEESSNLFNTICDKKDKNDEQCEYLEFPISSSTTNEDERCQTGATNEEDEFEKIFEELKTLMSDIEKRKIIRSCLKPNDGRSS